MAYRTRAPPTPVGTTTVVSNDPTEWLLLQLAAEVNDLLGHGLRRGYVERREWLPCVRGRTRPILNPAQLPYLDCEYSDFTTDTPENRLLRGVLELIGPGARNKVVRKQIADASAFFATVTKIRPTVRQFDRVHLTRLNRHYEPSLRLARLALEGAGVVDETGTDTAPAYFVPMWRVWEAGVAAALRSKGLHVVEQPEYTHHFVHRAGTPPMTVGTKPDLIIGPRRTPSLVIDLKWAPAIQRHRDRKRLRNAHQLASYCAALGCDGMLVYPLMTDAIHSTYEFSERLLHIHTVDLSRPALTDLLALAETVRGAIRAPTSDAEGPRQARQTGPPSPNDQMVRPRPAAVGLSTILLGNVEAKIIPIGADGLADLRSRVRRRRSIPPGSVRLAT